MTPAAPLCVLDEVLGEAGSVIAVVGAAGDVTLRSSPAVGSRPHGEPASITPPSLQGRGATPCAPPPSVGAGDAGVGSGGVLGSGAPGYVGVPGDIGFLHTHNLVGDVVAALNQPGAVLSCGRSRTLMTVPAC